MAWHIDAAVIHGMLDCRTRGCVSGRLWLVGREEPIELTLGGNPWTDLAGRVLEFENPRPQPLPFAAELARNQAGAIGDCTASKKTKMLGAADGSERWRNGLHLEWFGPDGRVSIESVTFRLRVSKESTWAMSAAEEARQRSENAQARALVARALREEADTGRDEAGFRPEANGAARLWMGWSEDALADFAAAIDAAETTLSAAIANGGGPEEGRRNALLRLERIRAYLVDVSRAAEFCTTEGLFESRWGELVQARVEAHAARIDGLLEDLRRIEE